MAYTVRLIDYTDPVAADKQAAVTSQLTTWFSAADGTRPPDKPMFAISPLDETETVQSALCIATR